MRALSQREMSYLKHEGLALVQLELSRGQEVLDERVALA